MKHKLELQDNLHLKQAEIISIDKTKMVLGRLLLK